MAAAPHFGLAGEDGARVLAGTLELVAARWEALAVAAGAGRDWLEHYRPLYDGEDHRRLALGAQRALAGGEAPR